MTFQILHQGAEKSLGKKFDVFTYYALFRRPEHNLKAGKKIEISKEEFDRRLRDLRISRSMLSSENNEIHSRVRKWACEM